MLAAPRILITRSRSQASILAAHLQQLGADPILIPTIEIAPPESFTALDQALIHLESFRWLVFTSANAVQCFANRLTSLPPKPPRVAAIGPATARALSSINLAPDLIPPQAVAESLAGALLPHLCPGDSVLLVRAEEARDVLPEALRAAGADLTIAAAYRNLIPPDSVPLLQSLFAGPSRWPDAITFTSSSTAANLVALLDAAGLTLPRDGDHGKIILRASIGPVTSRTLRDLGYPPHLEAPEPNVLSLAITVAASLGLPPR